MFSQSLIIEHLGADPMEMKKGYSHHPAVTGLETLADGLQVFSLVVKEAKPEVAQLESEESWYDHNNLFLP